MSANNIVETLSNAGWLTLLDGPLHGIRHRLGLTIIGYVKTHHRRMLAREHWERVPELPAGGLVGPSNAEVVEALAGGDANLAAGTAWLWAREEMAGAVDVLVIDEAAQMSLANTLAVCQAAGSLVLLGDPRQLDQPIQGVHPPGADRFGG